MATNKIEQLLTEIKGLTVLDLAELTKAIETEFGVTATASFAAAPAAATSAEAAAPKEEKTEFKVELTDAGANKINVIKALRVIKKDLGLSEAKNMVESAPCVLLENASKDEANNAKKLMEEAGAKVKLS